MPNFIDNSYNIIKYRIKQGEENNNILLISEKDQLAYLPYEISDIKSILKNSTLKYTSITQVINNIYTIPLKKFENSSISRFRETFLLVRNKEKGSIFKALDLSLELMFRYDLNPIIISACKNLEELDLYISCLDDKKLDEFDCFEIKFEMAPNII